MGDHLQIVQTACAHGRTKEWGDLITGIRHGGGQVILGAVIDEWITRHKQTPVHCVRMAGDLLEIGVNPLSGGGAVFSRWLCETHVAVAQHMMNFICSQSPGGQPFLDDHGRTVLHILLENDSDWLRACWSGITRKPYHEYASGQEEFPAALLIDDEWISWQDHDGQTPLHVLWRRAPVKCREDRTLFSSMETWEMFLHLSGGTASLHTRDRRGVSVIDLMVDAIDRGGVSIPRAPQFQKWERVLRIQADAMALEAALEGGGERGKRRL